MNETKPYGRSLAIFAGILLIVVFLTYRSFNHNVFYINWMAGLAIIAMAFTLALLRSKISKIFIITLGVSGAWLVVAVIVTPFVTDLQHHFKILVVSTFYLIGSAFFVDILYRSKYDIGRIFYGLLVSWFFINAVLLIAYYTELYIPAKRDFSGVFHDRNVFSITTLIIVALALSHLSSLCRKERILIAFMAASSIIMILVSKSITGFVGVILVFLFLSFGLKAVHKIAMLVLTMVLAAGVTISENPIKDRIDRFYLSAAGQTEQLRTNESAYIRMHLITSGFHLGLDHPITGVGLDNARFHVMWPEKDTGTFLHNTYLDIFTSGGFLMFAFYYLPILYVVLWLLIKRKYFVTLSSSKQALWRAALIILLLKLTYDLTWTTYFEFGMIFSLVFAIYSFLILRRNVEYVQNTVRLKYVKALRANQSAL